MPQGRHVHTLSAESTDVHPGANSDESIKRRVLGAVGWSLALRLFERFLTGARIFFIARLLTPADLGLAAIVGLVLFFLETFSLLGFRQALIQRRGDIRPYLDTAWTVELFRRAMLAVGVFISAPLLAGFFSTPDLTGMVRVSSLALFLGGFTNIGVVYFDKELEFRQRFTYNVTRNLIGVGASIVLVVLLRNAWALVLGTLAGIVAMVVLSYVLHPYRPHLRFEMGKAKELFVFGRWVMLTAPIRYLSTSGDKLILGKLIGAPALGLYEIAGRVSHFVSLEVGAANTQVGFPAFSIVQDNLDRLRRGFQWSVAATASIVLPANLALILLAEEFTRLILGEQWLATVTTMQILALGIALKSVTATSGPLLRGLGQPRLNFQKHLAEVVVLLFCLYPFIQWWSLEGAAWAVVVSTIPGLALHFLYVHSVLRIGYHDLAKPFLIPVTLCLSTAGMIILARSTVETNALPGFLAAVGLAAFGYVILVFGAWFFFKIGPLQGLIPRTALWVHKRPGLDGGQEKTAVQ